jgi:hypothetical protein
MDEKARDPETGIAIRFIKHFDVQADGTPARMSDQAFMLAMGDEREDVSFLTKLNDARELLRLRAQ